jgi:smad nuclear-interacting protein 1
MPRDSQSPPRNRARYDDDTRRQTNGRSYDDRRDKKSYDRRNIEADPWGRREGDGSTSRRDDRREYGDRERERERERDRERYDSARNRDSDRDRDRDRDRRGHRTSAGPSSRRSASPRSRPSRPHSERPRSSSRSGSPVNKAKPNFAPSGLLAAETNTVKAVNGDSTVLKYNEPPEARKPVLGWRLYVFKGSEQVGKCSYRFTMFYSSGVDFLWSSCEPELLHIHRQSAYLIGRDRLVADIAVDHPSCSKQHAAIQCAGISFFS